MPGAGPASICYNMGTHMKTTIEIADDVLARARREARREGKTLREVVDEALRQRLAQSPARPAFRLKKHPFKGEGLQAGAGDWDTVRDLIYRLG
jgi:Arc/MetJ family transcription regulator